MRSPLVALASCALLAAPLSLATGVAEAATCTAPELVSASVSPHQVVLGTTTPKGFVVTVGVRTNGCTVKHVDTDVFTPSGVTNSFRMEEEETAGGVTTYDVGVRVNPGAVANADAGPWTSAVYVTWGSQNTNDDGPRFQVLRAARLSTNATPEPVRTGKTLTVRGTLTRANWEILHYAGYARRHVELQFRPSGGTYAKATTVTGDGHGKVTAKVTATRDGCYRFVFRGSSTTAKVVSAPDCVDVR